MNNQRNLIVLRGLPGSGKSTLAHVLSENGKYPVFSIDDYFTDPVSGKYVFNHLNNHLAYAECEKNTRKAMQNGAEKIILHNTFTLEWEIEPYFKLAQEMNYRIHIVTVENFHKGKNVHDISENQIRKMAEKYKVVLY